MFKDKRHPPFTPEDSDLAFGRHMRQIWDDLPVTIYRPSIIVGDSKTGATSSFNVLYWPIRIFASGRWPWVIGSPDTPVDVVPVDWVSKAMFEIASRPDSLGKCFSLSSGDGASTVGELCELAGRFFDRPLPRSATRVRSRHLGNPITSGRLSGAPRAPQRPRSTLLQIGFAIGAPLVPRYEDRPNENRITTQTARAVEPNR